MAFEGKVCRCYQATSKEVWRPQHSLVDQSKPLNKVDVSFSKPANEIESSVSSVSSVSQSPTAKEVMENTRFRYAHMPGNPIRHVTAYCIQMSRHVTPCACVDDESLSERSFSDNTAWGSPGSTSRTNILSHMAKNKASWVESTLQNRVLTAQQGPPILIKGNNPHYSETPYKKSQRSKDSCTKGVRDGHRFDLLPISKYLAQSKREENLYKPETRLPLVRISSVQRIPIFLPSRRCYPGPQATSRRLPNTFFTEKDVFKPRELRSQPTRGEAAFVEIKEQLPSLYKKQYNAPVVKMGRDFRKRETAVFTLPIVTL